jgi:tripartite-type tricarboxylate transporter receptor subunit TctC
MRLLIPFPTGGSTEFTALTLAGPMGRLLGERVVVEARVGGAGIVALRELAHAATQTLMVGSVNTNSIAPVVFAERIDFDYDAAVRPVTRLVEYPSVAVTRRAVPAETLPRSSRTRGGSGGVSATAPTGSAAIRTSTPPA